jgi:ribose transport system permease protein
LPDTTTAYFPNRTFLAIKKGPWVIYTILGIFIVANLVFNPYFGTAYNVSNIINQCAALMLVSVGQTFVIIGGGFDFSVGGIVSLATCMLATLMKDNPFSYAVVIVLVVLMGLLIGFINGTGVVLFRINPFIMTIGTMSIAKGVSFLFREYPGGYVPPSYMKAMTGTIGFIPVPVILMLAAVLMGVVILRKTRFGRYVYAVGGDSESAKSFGLRVNAIKIATFVVSGLFAAISGLFMAARIASGDPRIGDSVPLDSITAVVLGGVIIGGGRGSLLGVVAGVFLIVILSNVLTLTDVSPYYQYIIKGVLLGTAVAVTFRKEQREFV